MGPVNILLLVGHLLGQLGVLIPGHVIGGILHAGRVEQILVVEQHPEVAAEGDRVLDAVHRVVRFRADEPGQIIAADVVGQRGGKALGLPVDQVVDFLDHDHVALVSAFQHRGGLHRVVLRSDIDVLDFDAGMGRFKGFLLGNQIGSGRGVPGDDGQHLVLGQGGHGQHRKQHHRGQQHRQHFLHESFLLHPSFGKCYRFHSSEGFLGFLLTILPFPSPEFV